MDKKALYKLADEIVTNVATKHGIEESEARALVGLLLKTNRDAIVSAVALPAFKAA